mgnify:FL=1
MEAASDAFALRGVIEGFYGRPWTHQNRLIAIDYFANFGMNLYIVGPKDAAWQRTDWRSSFSDTFIAEAAELVTKGKMKGIEVTFSISPGLSVVYSSVADRKLLLDKFSQLAECGVTHFCLMWDDIDWDLQDPNDIEKYTYIEDAQSEFSNWIYECLIAKNPDSKFSICPMIYWGRGSNAYINQIGKNLHPDINIMWTGRQIRSEYIDSVDAQTFARDAKRKPFYWDNFPVNNLSLKHELHLGPVVNRENNLSQHTVGLVANPMNQFWASLLPLSTVGRYLSSPSSYSPEKAWEISLTELFPKREDRDAMRTFSECFLSSPIQNAGNPRLTEIFTHYRNSDACAIDATKNLIHEIEKSYERIISIDFNWPDFAIEVRPWLDKFLKLREILMLMIDESVGILDIEQRNSKIQEIIDTDRFIVCREQIEEFLYESL